VKNLDKAYLSALNEKKEQLDSFIEFEHTLAEYDQLLESIISLCKARVYFRENTISLFLDVDSMDEMTPVLELVEDIMSIEFDHSDDYASEWYTSRTYSSKSCKWIQFTAQVKSGAAGCRSVVTGYESVPVYKIECDGVAA
jgi:hypothetical protein